MATTDLVKEVEKRYLKDSLPDIRPGDSVKVKIRIVEGNKERLQAYEGVVIKVRGTGIGKSVTVRRVFQGVGVERVFLLHSPKVESIQILRKGVVRRAKLYYLRQRTGKAARIREKIVAGGGKAAKAQQQAQAQKEQPQPQEAPQPEPQAVEPQQVVEAVEPQVEQQAEQQPEA
jgi:large subunit ribosomal protein L19